MLQLNGHSVKMERDAYCGPAVLQQAFIHFGIHAAQEQIACTAGFRENWGTPQSGMVKASEAFGLLALADENFTVEVIEQLLAFGGLAIINYMSLNPDGSYDANESGHYEIYLGLTSTPSAEIHLTCNEKGKLPTPIPRYIFENYWWDVDDRDGVNKITRRWAMLLFNNPENYRQAQENLLNLTNGF